MKIMMIGPVGSGKTSLKQRFLGKELNYEKTQAVEFTGNTIDTPGEYIENKRLLHALITTGTDADVVILVQDPTADEHYYSPSQTGMFHCEVVGVVTKIDLASEEQIDQAKSILKYAGCRDVFLISNETKEGITELIAYLDMLEVRTNEICSDQKTFGYGREHAEKKSVSHGSV